MNCETIQKKLLMLQDPRRVPDSLRSHLADCGSCRVWAERAGRLEGLLQRLPTPTAPRNKKAAFIADLMKPAPVELAAKTSGSFREWLTRNASLVGGLAAAIVVAVGAWSMLKTGPRPDTDLAATPKDPFLEKMVQRDVALAKANTPAQKLQALGGMADDLSAEARGLSRLANPDELKDVAKWYDRVVREGLVKQASQMNDRVMSPAERKAQLTELARKLGETADEVKKASGEVPPEAKPILERMVESARFGKEKLEKLAG
jgi:hypothetical protein